MTALPRIPRVLLPMILSLLLLLGSTTSDHPEETPQDSYTTAEDQFPIDVVLKSLREELDEYSRGIMIPGLPIININQGDQVSLTVSLSDIYLEGVSNWKPIPNLGLGSLGVTLEFEKISILVGSYTANGHILNLPFSGEGPMHLHLHQLMAGLSFDFTVSPPCAIYNSTDYDLDLIRLELQMDNLNEGTDQGQLVNIVVGSFGQDIVERLELFIKDRFYYTLDSTIVGLINSVVNCTTEVDEEIPEPEDLTTLLGDIMMDFLPL